MRHLIRRAAGRVVRNAGLCWLRWKVLPGGLYVLNYHRIGDRSQCLFDRGNFSCESDRLERHLDAIADRFRVVGLDEVERMAADPRPTVPGRPRALITFDDGYADNYTAAFPLLRRYGLSAVFFLPTQFIESDRIPWWDEISWLIRRSDRMTVRLPGHADPPEIRGDSVDQLVQRVLAWAKRTAAVPMDEKVHMVRAACGVEACPQDERRQLFVTWAQVREMAGQGMEFGSHTHSHRILAHLPVAEQADELGTPREIIREQLGSAPVSVSYPVGSRSAYTDATITLARRAGYRLGFNHLGRVQSRPFRDSLDINRLKIDDSGHTSRIKALIAFPDLAH
jgi:peptidoglycan/xylan/chitin deacetylase (PgdA/CDA1 family)